MTVATTARLVRQRILAALDRSPAVRRLILDMASMTARHRGGDPQLVRAAREADLPLERSLQAILWATAVAGRVEPPNHFLPGDHFRLPEHRQRAARAINASGPPEPGTRIMRDLISVADDECTEALAGLIADDLRNRFARVATQPQRGAGIAPAIQGELVAAIQERLARIDIRPFLMSGTLLGVIRDGGFMEHDYDIDLGILPGSPSDLVAATLADLPGCSVIDTGPRIVLQSDLGASVDIFVHAERDGLYWHSTLIHEWWNTPFGLAQHSIGGQLVWIPDDPLRYLDENYGGWARPVVFYDISFDTPNRRYLDNAHALRYLYSRCLRALEQKNRWLLEASVRELRENFGVDVTEHLVPNAHLNAPAHPSPPSPRGPSV